MFTGLISEVGVIRSVVREGAGFRMRLAAPRTSRGLKVGGSVAVDGVCLTAVDTRSSSFVVQVVAETARRTTLGAPSVGRRVNLERPLKASSEIGGHFLQGHVDATASVLALERTGKEVVLTVELPRILHGLLVGKGSIAVNGVSLTVAGIASRRFSVALIPHTLKETNLGGLKAGDRVNLEADILGKYVDMLLSARSGGRRGTR
ncbi:MAG TPA: riboflavin synthase [Candidatus Polarisedimenticolia bacterium]|nr:riboflavin synthase [Candidatus Polarisedimenticolia bacterium]